MAIMRRWTAAVVSAVVAIGLATAGVATCVSGTLAPPAAQMACCKAGHHTCHKSGSPVDCCKKHDPQQLLGTLTKAQSVQMPVRVLLASYVPAVLTAITIRPVHIIAVDSSPPSKPLGPPVYIAFSSLLI